MSISIVYLGSYDSESDFFDSLPQFGWPHTDPESFTFALHSSVGHKQGFPHVLVFAGWYWNKTIQAWEKTEFSFLSRGNFPFQEGKQPAGANTDAGPTKAQVAESDEMLFRTLPGHKPDFSFEARRSATSMGTVIDPSEKKYGAIESISLYFVKKWTVSIRVWREVTEVKDDYTEDNQDIIAVLKSLGATMSKTELGHTIAAMPRVNAVEIKEKGNGFVIYPTWP